MRWFYQKEDNDNIPFIVKIPFFKAYRIYFVSCETEINKYMHTRNNIKL